MRVTMPGYLYPLFKRVVGSAVYSARFSAGRAYVTLQWPDRLVGWRYRLWSRLLHRFNLHHTRRCYPNGDVVDWCEWCGLRGRVYSRKAVEALMK